MSENINAPKGYWDELRTNEDIIFHRNAELTSVLYPDSESTEKWAPDSVELTGYDDAIFDTLAYDARRCDLFLVRMRKVRLTLFADDEVDEDRGLARVYELNLRPGKEKLAVYPFITRLGQLGVLSMTSERIKDQRSAIDKLGISRPNAADYAFVRQELERGASGAYTRWSPHHDRED